MSGIKRIFKLVLCGDGYVGKTSIRKKFMGEAFDKEYLITLGADFAVTNFEIDDTTLVLQIWDLAGQDKFAAIRDRYYRNTNGILLVFDRTDIKSFTHINNWIDEYLKNADNKMVPIVILGNKSDLVEDADTVVPQNDIDSYLKSLNEWGSGTFDNFKVKYLETSAVTGQNIQESFEFLARTFVNS